MPPSSGPARPARILLVAELYPPEPRVGAFRTRKLAEALWEAGHDVHVLVMGAGDRAPGPLKERLTLHVAPRRRSPIDFLRGVRGGGASVAAPDAAAGGGASADAPAPAGREPQGLKRVVLSLLHTPDGAQGMVPALADAAAAIPGRFDLVYSTAPSFSINLAARRIAERRGVPWVMELRDPWRGSGASEIRMAESTRLADWLDRRLYEGCVRRAAMVVTVADGAAEMIRSHVGPARADRVVSVLNGIDEVEHDRPPRPAGRSALRVVYTGSVYPPRDPGPLVRALARLRAGGGPELHLTFAGATEPAELARIRAFTGGALAEHTEVLPWIPQQEVRTLIRDADLVLLPSQKWVRQIPNKLFDYLAARVPILALVEPGSEADRMLEAVGGHHVVRTTDGETRLDAVVAQAVRAAAGERRPVGDAAVLERWTVAAQQRRMVRAVEALLDGRPVATAVADADVPGAEAPPLAARG
jgi:glycosyltransferase involved in cell wall biosynthesis